MHQCKTIAQTLVVLSILNPVFAAAVVPREVRDTGNDVVVVTEDVTTVSERRRDTPGGTTPSQYSSSLSGGSRPHDSLPSEGSALLQSPAPSSHLWATEGPAPVHNSTAKGSTTKHHTPVT